MVNDPLYSYFMNTRQAPKKTITKPIKRKKRAPKWKRRTDKVSRTMFKTTKPKTL